MSEADDAERVPSERELYIAREQLAPVQRRLMIGFWIILVLTSMITGLSLAFEPARELLALLLATAILVVTVFGVSLGGRLLWAVLLRRLGSAPPWLFSTVFALATTAALVFTVLFASGSSVFLGAFLGGAWALVLLVLNYGMHSQPYQLAKRGDVRFGQLRRAIRAQGHEYSVFSWKARWILLDGAAEVVFGISLGVLTAVQPLFGAAGILGWALVALLGGIASRQGLPWLTVTLSWIAALIAAVPALGLFWGTVELLATSLLAE